MPQDSLELWAFVRIFLLAAILDAVWAGYFWYVSRKNAVKSALLSGIIVKLGAYITISYVNDHRLQWAFVLGSVAGTYITVRCVSDKVATS